MVLSERKKIEAYIRGLTDNIKGTVIGSKPTSLNELAEGTCLIEQRLKLENQRIAEGKKIKGKGKANKIFPEVFPDNFPGLLPPRQVEFEIELIPSAAPVARAPYRLAPSEMKELADQLQEFKGIHIDPAKIEAIKNWATPTTPTEAVDILDLYGRSLKTYTDHKSLQYILDQKEQNVRRVEDRTLERLRMRDPMIIRASKRKWLLSLTERKEPKGLAHCDTQQPKIPVWKWERITMDFIVGLSRTPSGRRIMEKLTQLYLKEIVCRHGVPISIISDRDNKFASRFWRSLQGALGTQLDMSTTYHPRTDGQSKRTIQTLEDMLRACVIDFGGSWDRHLPLVEFSYNNSYHASIKAAPFEALYGQKCRSPICWSEVGRRAISQFLKLYGRQLRNMQIKKSVDDIVMRALSSRLREIQIDTSLHFFENRRNNEYHDVKRLQQSRITNSQGPLELASRRTRKFTWEL
ncbi:putative reverse transcriptase domain-containing protein [Tanacetum coccineum]